MQRPRRLPAVAATLVVVATACGQFVTEARAAESPWPTRQHVAMANDWLPFAPPPAQPAGLCLVDTGVTPNADIAPFVGHREGIDGETPDDMSSTGHGTSMAMLATALGGNGTGTIGAAGNGAVRITSIRATRDASPDVFRGGDVDRGLRACRERATIDHIRVVSLSIGGQAVAEDDPAVPFIENATISLRDRGVLVVAAAGNLPAAIGGYANRTGVLPVAAADSAGGACAFSHPGAISAPGCGLDAATPHGLAPTAGALAGTSAATAQVSAIAAAVAAYRPELGRDDLERLLLGARRPDGVLDVTALLASAAIRFPPTAPPAAARPTLAPVASGPSPPVARSSPRRRMDRPRARVRFRRGRLRVTLLNRPAGGIVEIEHQRRGRTRTSTMTTYRRTRHRARRFSVRGRRPARVRLRYVAPATGPRSTLRVRAR